MDTYFAVACVILLVGLIIVTAWAVYEVRWWISAAREASAGWRKAEEINKRWREAYEAKSAQLDEARTRIDTLEGELTAADLSLAQARVERA